MPYSLLANYHTHTPRCRHAVGTEEEYIRTALAEGFEILGFADHAPWPYRTRFVSDCRMLPGQLLDYAETLRRLRRRYAGKLKLYIGLEAEYFPDYLDWLAEQKQTLGLDYLILGNHFDRTDENGMYFGACTFPDEIERYVRLTIQGMETGLYRYLAHPDLFLNHYRTFDRAAETACCALCEAAAALKIPLEYNLLGEERRITERRSDLGYTTPQFWQVAARYPVQAIVGCDAHSPAGLERADRIRAVQAQLREAGLTVLDTLPGLD